MANPNCNLAEFLSIQKITKKQGLLSFEHLLEIKLLRKLKRIPEYEIDAKACLAKYSTVDMIEGHSSYYETFWYWLYFTCFLQCTLQKMIISTKYNLC